MALLILRYTTRLQCETESNTIRPKAIVLNVKSNLLFGAIANLPATKIKHLRLNTLIKNNEFKSTVQKRL
jgi:hypothetical protein